MEAMTHEPGVGLVGAVWQDRHWQARTVDGTGPTDDVLQTAALTAGIAWPVELGGRFLAVLEFYTRKPLEVDEALRRCLFPMATQLAQFIARDLNTKTLLEAKDAAEAASRAKSQFLANVSHELRTPLNGVVGLTEILLDTELTPQQREYVGLIQSSAGTLVGLITDLLDFAQIEAAQMTFRWTASPCASRCGRPSRRCRCGAGQKGLAFDWRIGEEVPDRLVGDPLRVQQIFLNLVGNAIKFTPAGGSRCASACAPRTRDRGDALRLGPRHGHRHPAGQAGGHLRGVQPGRQLARRASTAGPAWA